MCIRPWLGTLTAQVVDLGMVCIGGSEGMPDVQRPEAYGNHKLDHRGNARRAWCSVDRQAWVLELTPLKA